MFKIKPFSNSTKVTYEKSSANANKIKIQVSSKDGNKSITASVFPDDVVKEIEEVNARPRDLANAG